jgi:hypothetical protein
VFEKHCQICGIKVKKETVIKRFGKYFCNSDHVQQYVARKMEEEKNVWKRKEGDIRRGGCC